MERENEEDGEWRGVARRGKTTLINLDWNAVEYETAEKKCVIDRSLSLDMRRAKHQVLQQCSEIR